MKSYSLIFISSEDCAAQALVALTNKYSCAHGAQNKDGLFLTKKCGDSWHTYISLTAQEEKSSTLRDNITKLFNDEKIPASFLICIEKTNSCTWATGIEELFVNNI